MISSSTVTILILGLLGLCSADITVPGPPRDVNVLIRAVTQLEENLANNQLAILHLLNGDPSDTMYERMSTMESEMQEDLRHLREVVDECTTLREDHMKLKNFVYPGKFFHHEGKDFYVNKEQKMSWRDSRKWCQVRGSDLAQPTGDFLAFKQQVLQLILPDAKSGGYEGAWMGGSDIASEGRWIWLSGTQLPNNFPWGNNEPNNNRNNEDCLVIRYKTDDKPTITCPENYKYDDHQCYSLVNFSLALTPAEASSHCYSQEAMLALPHTLDHLIFLHYFIYAASFDIE
ncbi:hypothetical protein Pmani_003922 [Petrolisthes manimaculis]|uniref:C-type lectin domain-containing protein n=1 Tax=Petrolisthes manimaculis TaxID=1843537 RepID=A0AAE1QF03_9EUCA|nr:hypothetical protein Pmani_003922 [Petrolisthes manimaculis]